jgi:hypothetical protein
MELPHDVLQIINDYAKPVTRPEWRRLHKMTYTRFICEFNEIYRKRRRRLANLHPTYRNLGLKYKEIFSDYNYTRIIYQT